jgi:PAS domain S-box-containing protein
MSSRRPGCPPRDRSAEESTAVRPEAELRAASERLAICEADLKEATRRLHAETARRRSAETAYGALVANSLQGLLILQGGRLVFTNRVLCDMTGYTDPELRAMSRSQLLNLIHPDERAGFDKIWRNPDPLCRFEARAVRRDGTIFWGEFFAGLITYNDEDAIQAGIIDITARKAAEDATREMNAWHRTVIDLSPDMIIAHTDWRIVLANRAAADLLGFATPDDLIGLHVLDFPIPGMQEIHESRYQRLISGHDIEPIETQVMVPDAPPRYLWVYPILTQFKGQPTVLIVGHDVTERKIAELALQHVHAELEERVEERTVELASANAGLQAQVAARERVEVELRRTNAEIQGLYAVATLTPQQGSLLPIVHAVLDQVWALIKPAAAWVHLIEAGTTLTADRGMSHNPSTDSEATFRRTIDPISAEVMRTGVLKIELRDECPLSPSTLHPNSPALQVAALPIRDGQHTVGVLGVLSQNDSEDGKQITQRDLRFLQSLTRQICLMVETTHLAEAKAEVELLRQMDELRSDLIANFSHELKSPLGVIKFSSTTLMRQDVDFGRGMQMELLSDIVDQTDHLSHIVEQILELGKLGSSSLKLRLEPTGLSELCERVTRSVRRRSPRHEISLDFDPPEIVVNADAQRIGEVVNNLLDNAIKYSPGGGHVRIRGRSLKGHALITITDEGIGITEEDLRHIFERFYRGHNDVSATTSGAGLGLPVCRGIVEAHAGKIWVNSRLGKGTTISFTLATIDCRAEETQ